MESDFVHDDWFHHNQYGRYYRPDHRPTKRFDPSRLVHCFQPHASFRRCQSSHLLDVVPKLGWINQEIIHIRFDLYVTFFSHGIELT